MAISVPIRRALPTGLVCLAGVGLFVLLAAGAGVMAGLSEPAARWIAIRLAAAWDEAVPGSIRLGRIEGSLLGGLTVDDIACDDRNGRRRLTIGRLAVAWSPLELLAGRLAIDSVTLSDITLDWDQAGTGLADLAPEGDARPLPDDLSVLVPRLPLPVSAVVGLERAAVLSGDRTTDRPPALIETARIRIAGEGDRIGLELEARGRLPAAGLNVSRVSLHAGWESPRLSVRTLEVETDAGGLQLTEKAAVDLRSRTGSLHLSARVDSTRLAERAGLPIDRDPTLSARLEGGPERLALRIEAELDSTIRVGVTGTGTIVPRPTADLALTVRGVDLYRLFGSLPGSLGLDGRATIAGIDPATLVADVELACVECSLSPVGAVGINASARVRNGQTDIQLRLEAAGAVALAAGRVAPDRSFTAGWSLAAPGIGRLVRAAGPDGFEGSVNGSGECLGNVTSIECGIGLSGRHLRFADVTAERADLAGRIRFRPTDRHYDLAVSLSRFDGAIAGIRFGLLSPLKLSISPDRLAAEGLELEAAGAVAAGRGLLHGRRLDVALSVSGLDLDRFQPFLPSSLAPSGVVDLSAAVSGRLDQPAATLTASCRGLSLRGAALGDLVSSLRIEPGAAIASAGLKDSSGDRGRVEARLSLIPDPGRLRVVWPDRLEGRISADGLDLSLLGALFSTPPVSGRLSFDAILDGRAADPLIEASAETADLRFLGRASGGLTVRTRVRNGRTEATVRYTGPEGQSIHLDGALPVSLDLAGMRAVRDRDGFHRLAWEIRDVDGDLLSRVLTLPPGIDFRVSGAGSASLHQSAGTFDTRLEGDVRLGGGETGPERVIPMILTAAGDSVRQTAHLTFDQIGDTRLRLSAVTGIPLDRMISGEADWRSSPIDLRLDGAGIRLDRLPNPLPSLLFRPKGSLDLSLTVSGALGEPVPAGRITLANGELTLVDLGQRISAIGFDLTLDRHAGSLERLAFSAGRGRGSGSGMVRLGRGGEVDAALDLLLERFPLQVAGMPAVRLDAALGATLARRPPDLAAEVAFRSAAIEVLALEADAPRPIPVNPRVTFRAGEQQAPGSDSVSTGKATLRLDLSKGISLRGPLVRMILKGVVAARVAPGGTSVSGSLDLSQASFDLLGSRFEVTEGSVTLPETGFTDPYVAITAVARIPEVTVTATIQGRISSPRLTLSSDPPMPQDQILTLLVTGSREPDEESRDRVQGKAASLLAAFQNRELERRLRDRLGIDRMSVTFGESVAEPILTLGKRLSRKLYVETAYHHNAPPGENRNQVRVEVQLLPRWVLESFFGDAAIGGVDLYWRTDFPNTPLPDAEEAPEPRQPGPNG